MLITTDFGNYCSRGVKWAGWAIPARRRRKRGGGWIFDGWEITYGRRTVRVRCMRSTVLLVLYLQWYVRWSRGAYEQKDVTLGGVG